MSVLDTNSVKYPIQQVETLNKLSNEINDIKFLFEFPKLYMSKYFDDLRYRVDNFFASKQIESSESETKLIYLTMISKIDSFEKECFEIKNLFTSNFIRSTAKSLEAIVDKFLTFKNRICHDLYDFSYYAQEIDELIYETRIQVEKIIFKNKTMFFLCEKKLSKKIIDNIDARLIFIVNEYVGRRGLNFLISK